MKNIFRSAGHKIRKIIQSSKRHYNEIASGSTKDKEQISNNQATAPIASGSEENVAAPLPEKSRTIVEGQDTVQGKYRKPAPPKKKRRPAWTLDNYQVTPAEGKSRFHDFAIPLEVMRAIAEQKFQYCTPIQEKTLEGVLAGSDLVGKANTGTGKTAVFLVAIFSQLLTRKKAGNGVARSLVLAPTRELVMQIAKDARLLAKYCNLTVSVAYGGVDYKKQQDALVHKKCDILIATPGRLLDFLGKNILRLDQCKILVLDEADRMLDMGFIPDVRRIVGRLPSRTERQTMLFSATVPEDVKRLASQWCVKPKVIEAEPEQVAVKTVEQIVYLTTTEEKYVVLYNLIKANPDDRIIVFANMKNEAKRLAERLQRNEVDCVLLSGDVAQNKRMRRLEDFREAKVKILVATDVAGRGIHIDGITLVVNYTLPYEPEDYVHRIGRTGRAGAEGKAVSFACEQGSFYLPQIEEYVEEKFECLVPEEKLFTPPPPPVKRTVSPKKNTKVGGNRHRSRKRRPAKKGSHTSTKNVNNS